MLVLGQNSLTDDIIREISLYAAPGSTITVASAQAVPAQTEAGGLHVRTVQADVHRREALEALLTNAPNCVIVLSESGEGDADARTLTLLLQLSHYYRDHDRPPVVISEMLSKKNQELASVARVNDFVIGTNLASLILTQVSQNRLLATLFDELLTDEGSEIYIKPASLFVNIDSPVPLFTLAAATATAGQPLLGLRLRQPDGGYTVLVNPDKEQSMLLRPHRDDPNPRGVCPYHGMLRLLPMGLPRIAETPFNGGMQPRRGGCPLWESPATVLRSSVLENRPHRTGYAVSQERPVRGGCPPWESPANML